MYPSLVSLAGCLLLLTGPLHAQKASFAATRFDLAPDLPFEDPAPSKDEPPTKVVKSESVPPPQQPVTPSPPSVATLAPFAPALPSLPLAPTASTSATSRTTVTPLPSLPQLLTFPPIGPGGLFSLPQPPLPLIPFGATPAPLVPQPVQNSGSTVVSQPQPAPVVSQSTDRVELWFREDYDQSHCPRDAESITRAFRRKFPRNLLRNGKEQVLAGLLSSRIKECVRKQEQDHWARVVKHLDAVQKQQVATPEQDECKSGLVQEQIACLNVLSFSCQFIQPVYVFRLVPTRLIVQEARLAEDGADKCRKFVRKFKTLLSE